MGRTLPVVLQTEATECGLACLAMIARYYGHKVDLNVLRDRHLISLKGATLKSLMSIAGSLQMASRPLRLDMEHLHKLQLPALLHWDMNHFVVLKKIVRGKAHIHDPGVGLRVMSLKKMGKHFTGVALEISPTTEFSPIDARLTPHLKLLWSRLIGLKRAIVQTLTLSILLQITLLAAPFYLQLVIDGALPSGDRGLLISLALGFGALAILRAVSEGVRGWTLLIFGNQMSLQMIGNVFRHLIRLPTGYFEKRHVGDIISRMSSTKPIQEALTQSVVAVLIDGVMAGLMLIVMYLYSPLLCAVVTGSVLLMALSTLLIYPHLRRTQEEAIYAKAIENTHVIETIRASTTIKLFSREYEREAAWRNLYTDFINANVEYGKFTLWQKFFETLLVGLQIVAVVYLAATLMMDPTQTDGTASTFTVGMLLAFLGYRQYFTDSVTQLLQKGIEFKLLSLHLDRLSDIIFAQPESFEGTSIPPQKASASALPPVSDSSRPVSASLTGRITLKNIWFRYSDLDPWILEDFSAEIPAGSMTTFTGPSGGGKTTLMKIILGLYKPTKGVIEIDGRPLQDMGLSAWRQSIGVVMQEDSLLSGTLADNISFFDPEINMGRVVAAARAARIHDDITAIPMNYMSMVGNMGSVLSGGQKQRVLLARALYNGPKVLFLDEGTANLDLDTEEEIVKTLADLKITRVIVAHRAAFLEQSDKLLTI